MASRTTACLLAVLWATAAAGQVLPILSKNCFTCHGADLQQSGLDLRSRDSMLKGGKHGPAIVPGDASQSRLYRRVSGQEDPRMPFGGKLSDAEIAALRDWINKGAVWDADVAEAPQDVQQYWAFRQPVRAPVPRVKNVRNPIDAFLMRQYEQKHLTPAPPANKTTLVRRAYLDLAGLPPTPEQVAAFVNDPAPDAWEKLIEKLLASPEYGERWGRHWLDVARYADSAGFEHDHDHPTAWRYRDYVIQSFQQDKPYSQFIREQLAGDEIEPATFESKTATGFLRAGPRVEYREKDNPQYRYDYLDDMIGATSQAFLGLTVQCARCHNHKFDPIPQTDYYRMQAVFFPYVDVNHYLVPANEAAAFTAAQEALDAKVKSLRQEIAEIEEPYKEKAFLKEVAKRFPEDAQLAVRTPEAQRTPGQKMMANQLLRAVGVPAGAIDRMMSAPDAAPDAVRDKARRTALLAQIRDLEKQRRPEPPYAIGVTDGDYRFAPDSYGDEPAPGKGVKRDPNLQGTFLHTGDSLYQPPPSYFLIRGEQDNRGPEMQPGFITAATYGNPPTAIPPSSGHTSGRRRALAEWIASPENPLTARVMVNRIWHYHFGRGIVATPSNSGRMGTFPTHPELLDWLATEFVAQGWSVKQMHRLMMTSRAYQMASEFEDAGSQKADPENRLLWKFRMQRLDAEALRDSILAVSGRLNREVGGPPVFPSVDRTVLATMKNGIWNTEDEGPKVWRRSVYVYRKRGMPFPMFEIFDLPDQNVTCGARNVSTVPTQALTLLNDEFVLQQAKFFAQRVMSEAGGAIEQLERAYQIALGRRPSQEEKRLGLEFLKTHSLNDLAHVMLNLNEFVYMR